MTDRPEPTDPEYRGLVVAGLGSVGTGLLRLAGDWLASFTEILALDREPRPPGILPPGARFAVGDLTDEPWLEKRLASVAKPAIFVNLCSGIDNVRLRQIVSRYDLAYLDSSCCAPIGSNEVRFSRMMPYTLTAVAGHRPQWLCWGINPGLVELVARRLMGSFPATERDFEVTIFEHDNLESGQQGAVGWCPEALIEEVMQSPPLEIVDGKPREAAAGGGTPKVVACWSGEPVPSRVVGHEDVWNLGRLADVSRVRFVYGLNPGIMRVFEKGVDHAREVLAVPAPTKPVFGLERIAVQVRSRLSGRSRIMVWEEDHHLVWSRHRINAVQYQTAKALLLAVMLLQFTPYGRLGGNFCAADLPVAAEDWALIDSWIEALAINWRRVPGPDIRLCQLPPAEPLHKFCPGRPCADNTSPGDSNGHGW